MPPKLARNSSGRVVVAEGTTPAAEPPVDTSVPSPRVQRNLSGVSTAVSSIGDLLADIDALESPGVPASGGLPFQAVVHFTNSSATLNLSSPWKVWHARVAGLAHAERCPLTDRR